MKSKHFILFLVFILLISCVSAVKPSTQLTTGPGELQIFYPEIEDFKFNQNFTLNFHIFNSTGANLTNASVKCIFHLYDLDGTHILENYTLPFDSASVYDFQAKLGYARVKEIGTYTYIIQCEDSRSKESGAVKSYFRISQLGYYIDPLKFIAMFLGFGIFIAILFGFIKTLGNEHQLFKFVCYLFIIAFITILGKMMLDMNPILTTSILFYRYSLWFIYASALYILIFMIYSTFKKWLDYKFGGKK